MDFSWLGAAVDFVILIGALILALDRIGSKFGWFKKKTDDSFEKRVCEIVIKILPDILYNHDIETRDKYKSDRQRYLEDIKTEVLKNIQTELCQVSNLDEKYEILACSARDVLREKIMAIYHKNKKVKEMTQYEREALTQYYKDYKAMNGNSYIDKYYNRMKSWKTIDDDYDDE
jgi:hypothetical protein